VYELTCRNKKREKEGFPLVDRKDKGQTSLRKQDGLD